VPVTDSVALRWEAILGHERTPGNNAIICNRVKNQSLPTRTIDALLLLRLRSFTNKKITCGLKIS
jgi:hypothetical protein